MFVKYKAVTFSGADVLTESGTGVIEFGDKTVLNLEMGLIEIENSTVTVTRGGIMSYVMKLTENQTYDNGIFKVTARDIKHSFDGETFQLKAAYDILTAPTLSVKLFLTATVQGKEDI